MKKEIKRLAHLTSFAANPIVYITTCTQGRRTILDNSIVHEVLHGIWERSAEMNGWYVGDYIIMPDHIHLFVRSEVNAQKMSKWMKMWKSVSSRLLSRELNIKPPIWQSDYFDRYLRTDESYRDKWLYVEENPVRASLVYDHDNWKYKGRINILTN